MSVFLCPNKKLYYLKGLIGVFVSEISNRNLVWCLKKWLWEIIACWNILIKEVCTYCWNSTIKVDHIALLYITCSWLGRIQRHYWLWTWLIILRKELDLKDRSFLFYSDSFLGFWNITWNLQFTMICWMTIMHCQLCTTNNVFIDKINVLF